MGFSSGSEKEHWKVFFGGGIWEESWRSGLAGRIFLIGCLISTSFALMEGRGMFRVDCDDIGRRSSMYLGEIVQSRGARYFVRWLS